jgi:hypothetical protein
MMLLVSAPILTVLMAEYSRPRLVLIRIAYFGYALSGLVVALFQLHLYVDGPEIFMAFNLFLIPIVIAGGAAIAMTLAIKSDLALWVLCAATLALGCFQGLTFGGIIGSFMNVIARAYVLLVFVVSAYGRSDWWPARTAHAMKERLDERGDHRVRTAAVALLALALGAYFLSGAYVTFRDAEWPGFMPPQLDIVIWSLSAMNKAARVWGGGALLLVLGVVCVGVGVHVLVRRRSRV